MGEIRACVFHHLQQLDAELVDGEAVCLDYLLDSEPGDGSW